MIMTTSSECPKGDNAAAAPGPPTDLTKKPLRGTRQAGSSRWFNWEEMGRDTEHEAAACGNHKALLFALSIQH